MRNMRSNAQECFATEISPERLRFSAVIDSFVFMSIFEGFL